MKQQKSKILRNRKISGTTNVVFESQNFKEILRCPNCNATLRKVAVKVHGAKNKAISSQCTKCDYFEFDPISSKKVVEELRETPLKIKQKIVKLSQDRLGIYFNSHVIRSLNLKKGEDVYISVPDKKRIVVELEE